MEDVGSGYKVYKVSPIFNEDGSETTAVRRGDRIHFVSEGRRYVLDVKDARTEEEVAAGEEWRCAGAFRVVLEEFDVDTLDFQTSYSEGELLD